MMANKQQLRDRWLVEPGLTIRRKVCDFKRGLPVSHGRNSDELFCLLEGLPFRDEVPSGKDFRGSDFAGGREFEPRKSLPLGTSSRNGSPSRDRKSTRLNSSHTVISYAVFSFEKKNNDRGGVRGLSAASEAHRESPLSD